MRYLQFLLTALTVFPFVSGSADSDVELTTAETAEINDAYLRSYQKTDPSACGCGLLKKLLNGETFFAGTETYAKESTKNWSATVRTNPKCVFMPGNAKETAKGVYIVKTCQAQFAIRGGGHMGVPGASNTQDGILFSLSGLKTLQLSRDKKTLDLGPSYTWSEVYGFLQPYGLYVLGGRVGMVGVPGLLLGGGINFLANKHGFAMDNVVAYEVVLASGTVVKATATNAHKDLYWALKGGGNNFGIVTKFTLKTYSVPNVWSRMAAFTGETNFEKFYSAITNFANSGYKEKGAGVVPVISWNLTPGTSGGGAPGGSVILVHEGEQEHPPIFKDFESIEFLQDQDQFSVTPPRNVSDSLNTIFPGNRHLSRVQSSLATLEATKIAHETFYRLAPKLADIPSLVSAGIAIQPITNTTLAIGNGNTPFAGIDPSENYLWYAILTSWDDAADDEKVAAWTCEVGKTLHAKYAEAELLGNGGREFLYMNDAQGVEDVFEGYGEEVLAKLRSVRERYDEGGKVFGKNGLCNGGFKF